jgi:hypothetical protein
MLLFTDPRAASWPALLQRAKLHNKVLCSVRESELVTYQTELVKMKEVSLLLLLLSCIPLVHTDIGGMHTYMNPCIKITRKKLCDMRLCVLQYYFNKKSSVQVFTCVLL